MTGEFMREGAVEVVVLVVTYNNAADIGALLDSIRTEAQHVSMRVVVADNDSSDGTLDVVARHPDVIAVRTGGNLGYSGGINVAARHGGSSGAVLILNPDLRVERGAVSALLKALASRPGTGIVVPRIVDAAGHTAWSLHNEPRISRALADGLLGPLWRRRPAALSEWVRDPARYERPCETDWATGAALLIARDAAAAVGEWDERFFLYSEETDYCRRTRQAGYAVWYEPAAVVQHRQGGSGRSPALDQLLAVNRVRYARKHHGALWAGAYRAAVVLGELVRSARPPHGATLRTVLSGRAWGSLPHAGGARPMPSVSEGGA